MKNIYEKNTQTQSQTENYISEAMILDKGVVLQNKNQTYNIRIFNGNPDAKDADLNTGTILTNVPIQEAREGEILPELQAKDKVMVGFFNNDLNSPYILFNQTVQNNLIPISGGNGGSISGDANISVDTDMGTETDTNSTTYEYNANLIIEPKEEKMLENLKKDTSLHLSEAKKISMIAAGEILFANKYEASFVAGIMGNIKHEGTAGQFESSAYSNVSQRPQYLNYMVNNYNYGTKYSGKNIVNVNLTEVYNMVKELEKNGYKGKFGLGAIQWTGGRTKILLETYLGIAKNKASITSNEVLIAESHMICNEIKSGYNFVYKEWKSAIGGANNSVDAAKKAGEIVCLKYEVPSNREVKKIERGKSAADIYNAMIR